MLGAYNNEGIIFYQFLLSNCSPPLNSFGKLVSEKYSQW